MEIGTCTKEYRRCEGPATYTRRSRAAIISFARPLCPSGVITSSPRRVRRHVRHFLFLGPDLQGFHLTVGPVRGELGERHLLVARVFDHVLRQYHFGRSLGIVTDADGTATALIGGPRFAEHRCSQSSPD